MSYRVINTRTIMRQRAASEEVRAIRFGIWDLFPRGYKPAPAARSEHRTKRHRT